MRQLACLSGCFLIVACSVTPVQTIDASDSGGQDGGGSGGSGTHGSGGQGGGPVGGRGGSGGDAGGTGGKTGGSGGGHAGASGSGGRGQGGGGDGSGGQGPDGGESCAQLQTDYGNALTAARQCTPGAKNQCQQLVDSSLECPGCQMYVNDASALQSIRDTWENDGCGAVPHACPAIACLVPTSSSCAANNNTSGGPNAGASPGGTCTNGSVLAPN